MTNIETRCNTNVYDDVVLSITTNRVCLNLYFTTLQWSLGGLISRDKCLNVHHHYYIKGYNPWEYNDDALTTLCEDCHKSYHEQNKVKVFESHNGFLAYLCDADICWKCGGSGFLPEYSYYLGGICFECQGEGVILPESVEGTPDW